MILAQRMEEILKGELRPEKSVYLANGPCNWSGLGP